MAKTAKRVEELQRTKDAPRAASGGAFTLDEVKSLVEALEGTDVTRLNWERAGHKISIRRGAAAPVAQVVHHAPPPVYAPLAPAPVAAAPAPAAAKAAEKPGFVVTAPLVGTFYRSPSPDSPPYVDVGSVVKKGQVLCIVEAMKLMNEIEAEVAGTVLEVLVDNGKPVEFGDRLFKVKTG